jgi:hypothetical protein
VVWGHQQKLAAALGILVVASLLEGCTTPSNRLRIALVVHVVIQRDSRTVIIERIEPSTEVLRADNGKEGR